LNPGDTERHQRGYRAWPDHRHGYQHQPAGCCPPAQHRDKAAYKTTEFITYVVVFAGILLASFLVKTGQDGQRVDYFRADKAWWYVTLLTIGYMIARGLAKSGSREPYDDDRSN
jgi:hypothetical protein